MYIASFFPTTVLYFNMAPQKIWELSVSESQLHCFIFHSNKFPVS